MAQIRRRWNYNKLQVGKSYYYRWFYLLMKKNGTVSLTEAGHVRAEELFGLITYTQ